MKKYLKEIIILIIQMLMFYLFPLTAGPTDMMGLVVILLFTTFILSIVLGLISDNKIKYLYPIVVALIFIPTIFIYYNESALVHSLCHLATSSIGLIIGTICYLIFRKKKVK